MTDLGETALDGPLALSRHHTRSIRNTEQRGEKACLRIRIVGKSLAVKIGLQKIDRIRGFLDLGRKLRGIRIAVVGCYDQLTTRPKRVDQFPEAIVLQLLTRQLENLGGGLVAEVDQIVDVRVPDDDAWNRRNRHILKRNGS